MLALLDDDGHRLTHAELDRRAGAWAAHLARAHGVRASDRVAVLALGAAEVFVVLAACDRIGAALVPLSWRLAPAELAEVVRDARPRVLLHDAAHADLAAGLDALTAPLVPPSGAPPAPPVAPRDPEAIAQILYTSGTTGRPRGALIPRRQVAFNAASTARLCGLGARDRVLVMLPLFHTGGLNVLATPALAAGGAAVVMRRFDVGGALAHLAAGVTATIAVPVMIEQLLAAGLSRRMAPRLRVLLVGGAPVAPSLLDRARAAGLDLREGYGLTEVGPNCFTFGRDGTVGRPVPGTEARLVDEHDADVPPGEVGELLLRGPHVTAGYLGQADPRLPGGWFRTGDLHRVDADGRHRVVGRRKEMFISGGENVYPAEVERVLAGHPDVVEAAVIGVPDPRWGEVGLAAVVARGPIGEVALDRWLRDRLAAYKVPRRWRFVAALPRTATGKVDRMELAYAARHGRPPHEAPAAPGAGRAPAAGAGG